MGAEHLQILSLNFQHVSIEDVGRLHVDPTTNPTSLPVGKFRNSSCKAWSFLSTCNRVEFVLSDDKYFCMGRTAQFMQHFQIGA